MIADVNADEKGGAFIGGLERSEHFEKVIQWGFLPGHDALGAFRAGEFRQKLSNIIRHGAILDIGAEKNVTNQDVKVEPAGNSKTTPALKDRVEQRFVV